jgi:hypothetical protein
MGQDGPDRLIFPWCEGCLGKQGGSGQLEPPIYVQRLGAEAEILIIAGIGGMA